MKRYKKGVSPVVATIALIAIVVILALIIFLWARGFIKESILKKGENVALVCDKLEIEAVYISDTGQLQITNIGNVPIYRFNVRTSKGGSINNIERAESLPAGASTPIIQLDSGGYDEIKIIPIILGQAKKSSNRVPYICKKEYSVGVE